MNAGPGNRTRNEEIFAMSTARLLLMALATALLSACASTTIRNSWIDATDVAGPPKKMAVFVAVTDDNVRRMAEDLTVRSMPAEVGAVPSYTLELAPDLN